MTNGICSDVVLPLSNQSISVTSESSLYRVHLKDSFLASLQFVPVNEEYEVAYAAGQISTNFSAAANLPVLGPVPQPANGLVGASAGGSGGGGGGAGHPAVFLGHFQPMDLQQHLLASGIACEIVGGVLVCCGGAVNVRKLNATQISIQGALCEEYFRIRDVLYDQYEIV